MYPSKELASRPVLVVASAVGVTGITVAGALVVALITAVTTNRRQREALNHDRALADLSDLRKLLDEVAITLRRAEDVFNNLALRFEEHGKELPRGPIKRFAKSGKEVLEVRARLGVRLGEDETVVQCLEKAVKAMQEAWGRQVDTDLSERTDEKLAAVQKLEGEFAEAVEDFTTAAAARAGIRHVHAWPKRPWSQLRTALASSSGGKTG